MCACSFGILTIREEESHFSSKREIIPLYIFSLYKLCLISSNQQFLTDVAHDLERTFLTYEDTAHYVGIVL